MFFHSLTHLFYYKHNSLSSHNGRAFLKHVLTAPNKESDWSEVATAVSSQASRGATVWMKTFARQRNGTARTTTCSGIIWWLDWCWFDCIAPVVTEVEKFDNDKAGERPTAVAESKQSRDACVARPLAIDSARESYDRLFGIWGGLIARYISFFVIRV